MSESVSFVSHLHFGSLSRMKHRRGIVAHITCVAAGLPLESLLY